MRVDILNALDSNGILKECKASSLKKHIANRLYEVKIPTKKSEKYRYFNIEDFTSKDLEVVSTSKDKFKQQGKSLVIEDGKVVSAPEGVEVEIGEFLDVDNDHFDGLYYLNHLLTQNAIILRVKKDISFNIKHIFNKEEIFLNYRVVIFIDANSFVEIYESIEANSKDSQILSGYDIFLSRDANLKFFKNQTLNENSSLPIFTNYFKVDSNATFKYGTFDFAKSSGLNLFKSELHSNSSFNAMHLLFTTSEIRAGTISEIVHLDKSSKSNQMAKNILTNGSRGIFDALIRVTKAAKYTSAHQNSKAILLDSKSYMASKPQLEIYIDELEASHGSTTGQLDENALFYLRSRGINKAEAVKMLILAFANEAIEFVDNKEIANHIYVDFEKAYYGSSDIECIKTCHECEDMILGS